MVIGGDDVVYRRYFAIVGVALSVDVGEDVGVGAVTTVSGGRDPEESTYT